MFDESIDFNCDNCGGSSPPPKFMIPPPPRPPFMKELIKCRDKDNINSSSYTSSSSSSKTSSNNIFYNSSDINLDNSDICEAIPILDASYQSSPSLQTSAMIAVFSLLLVLVILISSLFVWKHKRKVQNFLPCKTTTRGPHIGAAVTGGHSVAYEDPDAHLGHRPLMMRHHHNVEMLTKSVHYPSGYPMTRSPPHLVCNSPGPDPYRSNDNVYEELNPARGSDNESERGQSDDEFAEDELSLPSERNLNKLSSENKSIGGQVSTIYHEQCSSNQQSNGNERNSLLSSSSSDYNRITSKRINGSKTVENSSNNLNSTINRFGILSGVFRNTTGRNNKNISINNAMQHSNRTKCQNLKTLPHNQDAFNRLTLSEQNSRQPNANNVQSDVIIPSTQLLYDDDTSRNNLMQLAYNHSNNFQATINSSNMINNSRINNFREQHCYNSLDNDVERRNRINQLHHTPGTLPPVATIFRGTGAENISNNSSRYPQPYYTSQSNSILNIQRSRTNPKSLDRRRIITASNTDEPNYGYAEPVFHESLLYSSKCNNNTSNNTTILHPVYSTYVLPDYTNSSTVTNTGSFRTLGNFHNHYHNHNNQQQYYYHPLHPEELNQTHQNLYSRDSSFTSDSGYSHQTSSSAGNTRSPKNVPENRNSCIGSSDIKTPTSSTTPTNLSLPSSDSGCTINGPSSLNSIKLSIQSNCDKQNSNLTNTNSIPFGWARTRTANLNTNHKKCKDNNSGTTFSLGFMSTTNIPPTTLLQTTEKISTNNFNIERETERNTQPDNYEKSNIINHTNNCLSSSPNNNTNINTITNNNNNNSIINIISNLNDQTNRSVINSGSNNSFNNNSTNLNNTCKSQS